VALVLLRWSRQARGGDRALRRRPSELPVRAVRAPRALALRVPTPRVPTPRVRSPPAPRIAPRAPRQARPGVVRRGRVGLDRTWVEGPLHLDRRLGKGPIARLLRSGERVLVGTGGVGRALVGCRARPLAVLAEAVPPGPLALEVDGIGVVRSWTKRAGLDLARLDQGGARCAFRAQATGSMSVESGPGRAARDRSTLGQPRGAARSDVLGRLRPWGAPSRVVSIAARFEAAQLVAGPFVACRFVVGPPAVARHSTGAGRALSAPPRGPESEAQAVRAHSIGNGRVRTFVGQDAQGGAGLHVAGRPACTLVTDRGRVRKGRGRARVLVGARARGRLQVLVVQRAGARKAVGTPGQGEEIGSRALQPGMR